MGWRISMGDGMTMIKPGFVPLETGTEASSAAKFTEQQALAWLTDNPNTGKTVREIAVIWGWSVTTAWRFMKQDVKQDANFSETGGTSGTSFLGLPSHPPFVRMPYDDGFQWVPENEDVVVAPPQGVAIYTNKWGHVVIRAPAGPDDIEDSFVIVAPEHLPALIAKLTAILKETA